MFWVMEMQKGGGCRPWLGTVFILDTLQNLECQGIGFSGSWSHFAQVALATADSAWKGLRVRHNL